MLEHFGEALMVFVAAWRFSLSRPYRERKLREWRDLWPTLSGKAVIGGEILAAIVIGIMLPLWLIVAAIRLL